MAKKVVLAGACRTAIGTMGGSLSTTPAAELGAIVIKEALNRAGVAPEAVDQVYMGCVIQAGLGKRFAPFLYCNPYVCTKIKIQVRKQQCQTVQSPL